MNKLVKSSVVLIVLTIVMAALTFKTDFLTEQKKYARVRSAFSEKETLVLQQLKKLDLEANNFNILIAVYKDSDEFEIYAKKKSEINYKLLNTYTICSRSGKPGPKRAQGDYQVPEGFYNIDQFNPASNFHLSLGLNYPNQSDRRKSEASDLGGAIFIHGSCVTIGCLPMTDEKIKEIYIYAVLAKNNGQSNIPVYIFPFKMTNQNFKVYKEKYKSNNDLIGFWTNLKVGFDKFLKEKKELKIVVEANGDYKF